LAEKFHFSAQCVERGANLTVAAISPACLERGNLLLPKRWLKVIVTLPREVFSQLRVVTAPQPNIDWHLEDGGSDER
jgi:hypothetical protein